MESPQNVTEDTPRDMIEMAPEDVAASTDIAAQDDSKEVPWIPTFAGYPKHLFKASHFVQFNPIPFSPETFDTNKEYSFHEEDPQRHWRFQREIRWRFVKQPDGQAQVFILSIFIFILYCYHINSFVLSGLIARIQCTHRYLERWHYEFIYRKRVF